MVLSTLKPHIQLNAMANPFIGVRIPRELAEALNAHLRTTGQSKSDVVIEALRMYLGILPCHSRLSEVERRLAALEEVTKQVSNALSTLQAPPFHHAESSQSEHHLDAIDQSLKREGEN